MQRAGRPQPRCWMRCLSSLILWVKLMSAHALIFISTLHRKASLGWKTDRCASAPVLLMQHCQCIKADTILPVQQRPLLALVVCPHCRLQAQQISLSHVEANEYKRPQMLSACNVAAVCMTCYMSSSSLSTPSVEALLPSQHLCDHSGSCEMHDCSAKSDSQERW